MIGFRINSDRRDAIDLDIERAGKRGDVKEDADRRLAREKFRINVIEDRKVPRLGRAIDIALEHIRQRRAGGGEAFLHLRKDDPGLPIKRQPVDLSGSRLEWRQA